MNTQARDVLSPREVAERAGFSYHAILRAIRRGDLAGLRADPRRTTGSSSPPTSAGCDAPRAELRSRPSRPDHASGRVRPSTHPIWVALPDCARSKARAEWTYGGRTTGSGSFAGRRAAASAAATFDRKSDAQNFDAWQRRRRQLGKAAVPDDVKLCEFVETYWQLHAVPNLSEATRDLYGRIWDLHILPRLGEYGVREITPKRLIRFRADLENAKLGTATIVKAMTIVQSILSFAVSEELVEYNAAAGVPKPRYTRAREPHIFMPPGVEQIRANLNLRDATLVSVLAYSGPRPDEVVCRLAWDDIGEQAIRYVDTKRLQGSASRPLRTARRRPRGVARWRRAPDRSAAGRPRPRRRILGPGRLAQTRAGATWQGESRAAAQRPRATRTPGPPGLRAQALARGRPPLELRDAARLRGRRRWHSEVAAGVGNGRPAGRAP